MSSNPISRSEELPVDTIKELSDKIDNLLGIVATKDDISSLNTRLDGIDNRLRNIESNFIYIRGRLDKIDINR
jgi:tetrahydromethanopterin S-methyltransferase subunit G